MHLKFLIFDFNWLQRGIVSFWIYSNVWFFLIYAEIEEAQKIIFFLRRHNTQHQYEMNEKVFDATVRPFHFQFFDEL